MGNDSVSMRSDVAAMRGFWHSARKQSRQSIGVPERHCL